MCNAKQSHVLVQLRFEERRMAKDGHHLVVVHHPEMVHKVVGPLDLNTGDTGKVQSCKCLFQFQTFMAPLGFGWEMLADEIRQCLCFPVQAAWDGLMGNDANFHHEHQPDDKVDGHVVASLVCRTKELGN